MGAAVLAGLSGCEAADEAVWEDYSSGDDTVEVLVGTECDPAPCAPVETTITSTTGAVEVATGSVDPGGGPIGTIHTVSVFVYEEFDPDVGRVTVTTNSGKRGEDEYDLDRDSAGQGYWLLEIQSVGEQDEVRTDTLAFHLYQEVVSEDDEG